MNLMTHGVHGARQALGHVERAHLVEVVARRVGQLAERVRVGLEAEDAVGEELRSHVSLVLVEWRPQALQLHNGMGDDRVVDPRTLEIVALVAHHSLRVRAHLVETRAVRAQPRAHLGQALELVRFYFGHHCGALLVHALDEQLGLYLHLVADRVAVLADGVLGVTLGPCQRVGALGERVQERFELLDTLVAVDLARSLLEQLERHFAQRKLATVLLAGHTVVCGRAPFAHEAGALRVQCALDARAAQVLTARQHERLDEHQRAARTLEHVVDGVLFVEHCQLVVGILLCIAVVILTFEISK